MSTENTERGTAALRSAELDVLAALTAYVNNDLDAAWVLLRQSADQAPRMTATTLLGLLDQALRRLAVSEGLSPEEAVRSFCLERALDRP